MATNPIETPAAMITPRLIVKDPVTAYWFSQVNLRLRREVSWCWYQRMQQPVVEGVLPPVTDAASENLDLVRYINQKQQFFKNDTAAAFLTEQMDSLTVPEVADSRWQWLSAQLHLDAAEQFVLALALAARLDAGLAPIFATCLNDLARPFPTLALAQRLWDEPVEMIACADPNHSLFRYGLLRNVYEGVDGHGWQKPLDMPSMLVQQLIDPDAPLPEGMTLLREQRHRPLDVRAELLVARLHRNPDHMQVVPLLGPGDTEFSGWAGTLAARTGRSAAAVPENLLQDQYHLLALAGVCWLRGLDVALPEQWTQTDKCNDRAEHMLAARELPLRWYLPMQDSALQRRFPNGLLTPPLTIKGLDFEERVDAFKQHLGLQAGIMEPAVEECARRFRFQEKMIARLARTFAGGAMALTQENLRNACANEAVVEMDNLAQLVTPRFSIDELVLPGKQAEQFRDILHAMQSLTVVHYHWGTARVWNESGLSVLFCGPPGTGKTMSAEVLASELELPMFRIDLSQVVNKYIGETEKNLKRIFDAAELNDCILFFDEADALFGKRTDVKDAHDRFANIEISYLLERMERFKGLAILATNRRKDLDEAFMRRLRYVIEFPMPDVEERKRIWQQVFPDNVDISELDIRFLAKQFQLSGGHIRSIAFNACLRAADVSVISSRGRVGMPDVLVAVKRELEKMNRSASDELFGQYSHVFKECA